MFLFVFFVEMGSHALIDGQDANAVTEASSCSLDENVPAKADCPDQRRQRQEAKDLMDEMTTHVMVINNLTVPHTGRMYDTGTNYSSRVHASSAAASPPFHPPKQA